MFCVQTKADFLFDQLNHIVFQLSLHAIFPRDTVMLFYPYSSRRFWEDLYLFLAKH